MIVASALRMLERGAREATSLAVAAARHAAWYAHYQVDRSVRERTADERRRRSH